MPIDGVVSSSELPIRERKSNLFMRAMIMELCMDLESTAQGRRLLKKGKILVLIFLCIRFSTLFVHVMQSTFSKLSSGQLRKIYR